MEKSKRSEATLTVRMNHEDDHGMSGDSNLSHSVRASNEEDSQGTMTLTDNKEERLRKTKDLQCMMPHALTLRKWSCEVLCLHLPSVAADRSQL